MFVAVRSPYILFRSPGSSLHPQIEEFILREKLGSLKPATTDPYLESFD
jgi:hypothetical protein